MFKSANFRKIFAIRFLAYFLIQVGILSVVLTVEPVINEEVNYQFNQLTGRQFLLPKIITSDNREGTIGVSGSSNGFGDLAKTNSSIIVPESTEFGIVIEKINANAKVVDNVDPSDERAYVAALGHGVAQAKGTAHPGEKGNIYLFSHSTDAPWNIVRFNAIFYLLGKLDRGDRIIMFYQGRRFDYIVFDKTIVSPTDTHFLTDSYNESVLTLQTCDPPGTLVNRLLVRAKLAST